MDGGIKSPEIEEQEETPGEPGNGQKREGNEL
jgi:hypothetical protein